MKKTCAAFLSALAVLLAACGEAPLSPSAEGAAAQSNVTPEIAGMMSNYVAIGTSISMGWASDGVVASSQNESWTRQLADGAGVDFTVPEIAGPGCPPPLVGVLIAFKRADGSSAGASSTCAPNADGVVRPSHNLAVENATAREALTATPETATQGRGPVTSRILPSGMTQVSAMRSLNPTFVSVEFGGNEILPAQVGLLFPGLTYTPLAVFTANYDQIIENVKATGARAVLATVRTDLRRFPTIRTGPEIAAQRSAFTAYNVSVNANCDESPNYIFVRGKVLTAIITGITRAAHGLSPFDLSCADVPGTPDYVLTPGDIAFVNSLAAQMSDHIEARAAENGYAVFSLGALYDKAKNDVPFDLHTYLNSPAPYGGLISLDGVHPSAAGQRVLARAARQAIHKAYGTSRR